MNILLIAQNYHPCVGGVEIHARQIAHEMNKAHCVQVAAGNFAVSRLPPRLNMLNTNLLAPAYVSYEDVGYGDNGVPVEALTPTVLDRARMLPIAVRSAPYLQRHAYHGLNRFSYPWFRSVYLPRLRRLMEKADVVHSLAGGYLGWTAQAAAQERGLPFVCTPFAHPKQWGDGPEDVAYYQGADAVIGLVPTDRDYLASIGVPAEKLHVIGVSPDLPATTDPVAFRHKHGLSSGCPIVLYVGRMMPQKGAKALLAAARKVWKILPEVHFVFIGPATPSEAALFENNISKNTENKNKDNIQNNINKNNNNNNNKIENKGADSRIHYLGKVAAQEKADALAACNVFCMPSLSEILPTVYLEAWSFGKPVVGGQAHGLPELIEGHKAGYAVSQDPDEIARTLTKLLQNPDLCARLGAQGRELVARNYSVMAVTQSLLYLYQSVMSSKRG